MPNNRILIADDEADLTEIIGAVAEDIGFQVTVVHEGNEVISRVSAVDPSIIMLDLRMPGADGVEVMKQLADIGSSASILLMSGLGQSTLNSVEHVGKEKNLNVIGSLSKPLLPEDIEAALIPLLDIDSDKDQSKQEVPSAVDSGFGLQTRFLPHATFGDPAGQSTRATLAATFTLDNQEEIARGNLLDWAYSSGISKWLLQQILRDALQSPAGQRQTNGNLVLGFRLDNEKLVDENMVEYLSSLLESYNFSRDQFVLEIDDKEINRNYASAAELLSRLRIKGFRIAVTTQSSSDDLLGMIDKLPMDEIVIDLEWLNDNKKVSSDMELEFSYSSLNSVAKKKGITTCADNVHAVEVLDFVKRCAFDQARGNAIQGYEPISKLNS